MAQSDRVHGRHGTRHRVHRGLGLYDSTMVVVGSMIGSGIFIVSADMARNIGSPGWLLAAWVLTGAADRGRRAVVRRAGRHDAARRRPVRLSARRRSRRSGAFLYGWTLFLVIQTGTIAAVAVGFARYFGVLVPWIAEDHYLVAPDSPRPATPCRCRPRSWSAS